MPCGFRDLLDDRAVGGKIQKSRELTYEAAYSNLPDLFKLGLIEYYSHFERELKVYNLLTIVCYLIDLIANLVFLVFTGKSDWPAAFSAQLWIMQLYHFTTLGLFFYAVLNRFKIPRELQKPVFKAMLGFGTDLKLVLSGQEPLPKPPKKESKPAKAPEIKQRPPQKEKDQNKNVRK